jgi:hypothetical protein
MKKEEEFTELRTFGNSGEAELMKALLESAGIDSFVRGDIASAVLPMLSESDGIGLVVRSEDVARAEEFLKANIVSMKNEK